MITMTSVYSKCLINVYNSNEPTVSEESPVIVSVNAQL